MKKTIRKKIVMLGSFAVGKSSLVRRFVKGMFSDQYMTTVGVKIDKKDVELDDQIVSMVLWDLHGEDEFQKIRTSYLRGSAGFFIVVDGTRRETLDVAIALRDTAWEHIGDVPYRLLVNKCDLEGEEEWELREEDLSGLAASGWPILKTSAKSDDGVEGAFLDLARRMVSEPGA